MPVTTLKKWRCMNCLIKFQKKLFYGSSVKFKKIQRNNLIKIEKQYMTRKENLTD